MLIEAKVEGLPDAVAYNLSYEIKADTAEAEAAIGDMIQYLQDHNTIKWWRQNEDSMSEDLGSPANQQKDDVDKLLQFNVNIENKNSTTAEPNLRVQLPIDIGYYSYLHVREDEDHSITGTSGAAWTISDENFKFSEPSDMGYDVEKNMTIKVNGTEYELMSIEYEGIEESNINFLEKSFIDRSKYKGKDDFTNVNIRFEKAYLYFTMPYNDVKLVFNWRTVGAASDIADAKTTALRDIQNTYNRFDLSKYDDAGKIALSKAKTDGETAVDDATTLGNIANAKNAALAAMMAVRVKAEEQPTLPIGVVLPDYGNVIGKVKVSVRNDTYRGGDFTGGIIDGWYDLCERDTMMTCILKALATEGYTWKGTGGNGREYDYDITYLSSLEKGNKKLAEFSGEAGSGWMGTLNDWFTNEGFNAFGVRNGNLENGDIVEVQYTQNLGEDIGGTWGNSDTTLKALSISGGTLAPSFKGSVKEYKLLIDTNGANVTLTPTASNKNYLVKTFLNNYNRDSAFYKRTQSISVKDGDIIYVGVGDKSWPSMNKQGEEAREYEGTKYVIKVIKTGAESVNNLIADLPDADRITYRNYLSQKGKIEAARTAYDSLADKSSVTNLTKLIAVEAKVKYYVEIENVKLLMKAIPSVSKITLSHKDAVMAVDAAYKKLNADQKKYIIVEDVTNYNAAIDRLIKLGAFKANEAPPKVGGSAVEEVPVEIVSVVLMPEAIITGNEGKATITKGDANKAVEELKKEGGNELLIQPKLEKAVDKLTVEIPKTVLKEIADDTKAVVTVKSNISEMIFSQEALKTITREAGANVTIIAEKVGNSKLSQENKVLVGDNPVFNFSIEMDNKAIKNFKGKIKISIPYIPKKDENTKKLTIYYIDDNGKATEVQGAHYDERTGMIVFETDHFSNFAIVYDEGKMLFDDVKEGAWYYDAVQYVTNNKLFNGISDTTFSPNAKMTRAMLVTVLNRMEEKGKTKETTVTSGAVNNNAKSFTDVKVGSWYEDAVKWASENGIVSGYSDVNFGPDDSVTREQLATILHRYAKTRGKDVLNKIDLSLYKDSKNISSYAKDAMSYCVGNKIVTGRRVDTLEPQVTATRAEVATMLMRYK